MRIGSVCTGIGGLDLGFERAGFEVAWMAEIDPWASRVLEKRWPGVPNIGDWTVEFPSGLFEYPTQQTIRGIDLLIGGIPCQGHSVAGRREGKEDARNLWPAFAKLLRALQPRAFVIENVPGLLTSNGGDFFADLLADCDRLGYSVEWDILSAAAVGAPHRRDRAWILGRRDGRQTWPQQEQPSLFPGRPQSWPKAGRWTDGTLHERERQWPTPSGALWPTPRTSDTNGAGEHGQGGMDLRTAVSNWTTPRAGDSKQGPSSTRKHLASGDLMLTDEVRLWGTASARDWKDGACQAANVEINGLLGREVVMGTASGRLSADWTETLMGLPVGWTDPSRDEPEPRPYPWPMACGDAWPTPQAYSHDKTNSNPPGVVKLDCVVRGYERGQGFTGPQPLYGASPQAPWEPPRLVEPVKGDGRRHRLRCIGNAVVPACAEVIARSIAASLEREEEHAHAAR